MELMPPSMVSVPAVIPTFPAFPRPDVSDSILPPLSTWSGPPTTMVRSPPLPVAPALLSLDMPVRSRVPPSMVSVPAVIPTFPASPRPDVSDSILPPLST